MVSGRFDAMDINDSQILIQDLDTPFGTYPHTKIRMEDVVYLEMDLTSNK